MQTYRPIKILLSFITLIFVFYPTLYSQNNNSAGLSIQWYPAGVITSLNYNHPLDSNLYLVMRAGANFIDRKDFSEYNEHEEGKGIGVSVGLCREFQFSKGQLFAGLNNDIWYEWIDWEDQDEQSNVESGRSEVWVLQPWLEAGYLFGSATRKVHIGPSIGFGREINVITNGENVGQGWILSALGNVFIQF